MNTPRLIGVVILSILICANVFGIGIIIPERIEPRTELKPLAIIRQEVRVNIKNDVARTHITQVFYNHYPHQLEATYIFPVPPEAQITDFVMYIEGKPVRGEIMEKSQARAIYEDIVRKMRDPALLEYYDWQLFKMRIFPVPARGKQKVEIEYVQVLKVDNNVVHYSFPVSKRDFAEVNTEDLKEWTFTINLQSDRKIKTIYSPAYELNVDMREDQQSAQIKVSPEHLQKIGNDVDIYYTYSTSEYGLNILTHRPYADEPGYFLLIISPGKPKTGEVVIPKDIIFVVDTSGSMSGEKIEQVKKAVKYCINSLSKTDRFNIISFSTDVQSLSERLLVAEGENLIRAIDFTEELQARGGTNINEALITALKLLGDDKSETESLTSVKRLKQILFLTDGLPTVGVTNPNQILENIEKLRKRNLRIFVFGVGYDVNTKLLDGVAQRTRALATYI
ncbi:MAG: VIT domain-containing protein, partial [Candidatus Sumerlaeia bacterium]|nr:VIT domain-containing protein [Candidatus Sumerlaeia bacterium]